MYKENCRPLNYLKITDFLISNFAIIQPIFHFINNGYFDSSFILGFGVFTSYWERQLNPGTWGSITKGVKGYAKEKEEQLKQMNCVVKAVEYGQRIVTHGILWSSIALGVYELLLRVPK